MVELPSSIFFPEKAAFGRRSAAALLDIFCDLIGGWLLSLVVGATLAARVNVGAVKEAFHVGSFSVSSAAFLSFLLFVFFKSFLEPFAGASLGAFALRLHIGDAERGSLAENSRLWLRWVVKYSPLFCLFAGLIFHVTWLFLVSIILTFILVAGFFWSLTASGQTFYDVLSGTALFHSHDEVA